MANFFSELKRRHIYRVGAAYVVVAWALTQLVDVLSQVFALPGSIAQPMLVLLAIGFPVALIAAWMIESKPHQAVASAVRSKPTVVDWTLCGTLAAVLLFMGYQQITPSSDATTRQAGVDLARSAALNPAGAISVAVLPFTNLSSDPEQEFFSDGMTEEITGALAKVPDLRVVARTSAFEFKGQNRNIQSIGQQLRATHLIEGSVRKAGDRVRITVQLIKADDGTHVWSENYDRQLTDIFAIQEDIARTVTASFNMTLGLRPGENLVNNRSIDPVSYQQFLRAKALYRTRGLENVQTAIELLKQVVAGNPAYAPAWALLARTQTTRVNYLPSFLAGTPRVEDLKLEVQATRDTAEPAARKAIELDPSLADGYVALSVIADRAGKFVLAEELYAKANALDADNADGLAAYSQHLHYLGRIKEALPPMQQANALEPFVPIFSRNYAMALWVNGDDDAALAQFKSGVLGRPGDKSVTADVASYVALVQAGKGRFAEAADTLASGTAGNEQYRTAAKEAERLLRIAPNRATLPNPPMGLGMLDFAYIFVGAPERVLDYYERNVQAGWMTNARSLVLWHPSYAPVRKNQRFKDLMRDAGYVDYWMQKGWPDLCRPIGTDDFECD